MAEPRKGARGAGRGPTTGKVVKTPKKVPPKPKPKPVSDFAKGAAAPASIFYPDALTKPKTKPKPKPRSVVITKPAPTFKPSTQTKDRLRLAKERRGLSLGVEGIDPTRQPKQDLRAVPRPEPKPAPRPKPKRTDNTAGRELGRQSGSTGSALGSILKGTPGQSKRFLKWVGEGGWMGRTNEVWKKTDWSDPRDFLDPRPAVAAFVLDIASLGDTDLQDVMLYGANWVNGSPADTESPDPVWGAVSVATALPWFRGLGGVAKGLKTGFVLKSFKEGQRAADEYYQTARPIVSTYRRATGKSGIHSRPSTRVFEVNDLAVGIEAGESRLARGIEGVVDTARTGKSTMARAGKEVRRRNLTRTRVYQEGVPRLQRHLRRIGGSVDADAKIYALRLALEGTPPKERAQFHLDKVKEATNAGDAEAVAYHAIHANLASAASRYVDVTPNGVVWGGGRNVDLTEAYRLITEVTAPNRERYLKNLGVLTDAQIKNRAQAPARVIAGAEWQPYEDIFQRRIKINPAREEFILEVMRMEGVTREVAESTADAMTQQMKLRLLYDGATPEEVIEGVDSIWNKVRAVRHEADGQGINPAYWDRQLKLGEEDMPTEVLLNEIQKGPSPETKAHYAKRARALIRRYDAKHLPEGARTPSKLRDLLLELRGRALEAELYKRWYATSASAILREAGGDEQKAIRLAMLFSIYSPLSAVWDPSEWNNTTRAIGAFDEWVDNGMKPGSITDKWSLSKGGDTRDWQTEAANAAMDEMRWQGEGRKTSAFAYTFIRYINPEMAREIFGDIDPAVIDTWMRRAFKYAKKSGKKKPRGFIEGQEGLDVGAAADFGAEPVTTQLGPRSMFSFMEDSTREIADELGWSIDEAQAAIWTSIKAEQEGTALSAAGTDFSHGIKDVRAQQTLKAQVQELPLDFDTPFTPDAIVPKITREIPTEENYERLLRRWAADQMGRTHLKHSVKGGKKAMTDKQYEDLLHDALKFFERNPGEQADAFFELYYGARPGTSFGDDSDIPFHQIDTSGEPDYKRRPTAEESAAIDDYVRELAEKNGVPLDKVYPQKAMEDRSQDWLNAAIAPEQDVGFHEVTDWERIALQAQKDGGATIKVSPEGVVSAGPTNGFVVSDGRYQRVVPADEFTGKDISAYWRDHRGVLSDPETFLGVWQEDGVVYLDVSRRMDTLNQAIEEGKAQGQLSVYDVEGEEVIPTGLLERDAKEIQERLINRGKPGAREEIDDLNDLYAASPNGPEDMPGRMPQSGDAVVISSTGERGYVIRTKEDGTVVVRGENGEKYTPHVDDVEVTTAGVADFSRGTDPTVYTGPEGSDVGAFMDEAAQELKDWAEMARDIAKTLPEEEWPAWVRNQIRKQSEAEFADLPTTGEDDLQSLLRDARGRGLSSGPPSEADDMTDFEFALPPEARLFTSEEASALDPKMWSEYVFHGTDPVSAEKIWAEKRLRLGTGRAHAAEGLPPHLFEPSAFTAENPRIAARYADGRTYDRGAGLPGDDKSRGMVIAIPKSALPQGTKAAGNPYGISNPHFGGETFSSPEDLLFNKALNNTKIMGAAEFGQDGAFTLHYADDADVETFVHEVAHWMRRNMTPQQQKSVARMSGARKRANGEYVWTREAEEKFVALYMKMIHGGTTPPAFKAAMRPVREVMKKVVKNGNLPDMTPHQIDLFRKVFADPKPLTGGKFVGAEDLFAQSNLVPTYVGYRRGIPASHNLHESRLGRTAGAYARMGREALFGGGRGRAVGAGPVDKRAAKTFKAGLLSSGEFASGVEPTVEDVVLASRMRAAFEARKELLAASQELPSTPRDIPIKVDPKVNTSPELRRLYDLMTGMTDEMKWKEGDLKGLNLEAAFSITGDLFPAIIEGRAASEVSAEVIETLKPVPNIRWVSPEFVDHTGLLATPPSRSLLPQGWQQGTADAIGIAFDSANDLGRAMLTYFNPAYIPMNLAGNLTLMMLHQGVFAPVNLYRAGMMYWRVAPETRTLIDTVMGTGFAENVGFRADIEAVQRGVATIGHVMGIAIDMLPRRAAFLHEAAREGFKGDDLIRLMKRKDEEAIDIIHRIRDRAADKMVDFERMSEFEKRYVSRFILFYPWIRGASRTAMRLAIDRPYEMAALLLMYDYAKTASDEELGKRPTYAAETYPISTKSVGLGLPFTDKGIGLDDIVGERTWRSGQNPMTINIRQLFPLTTPKEVADQIMDIREGKASFIENLQTFPQSVITAAMGYDTFYDKKVDKGFGTFLDQMFVQAPLPTAIKRVAKSDEQREEDNKTRLNPRSRLNEIVRVFGGSPTPQPYNPVIGQRSVAFDEGDAGEAYVLDITRKAATAGFPEPPPQIKDAARWRGRLDAALEGKEGRDRAEAALRVFVERFPDRAGVLEFLDNATTEDQYDTIVANTRKYLYPNLNAYERALKKAEGAAP